jgi:hypothetical protein
MIQSRRTWLFVAFSAGLFAVGIPYWLTPYRQVNLPDALFTPALLVVVLAAFVVRTVRAASFWRGVLIVGSAVPAAVMARVSWETTRDPTSHNLWPFELIIALMVGLACSLGGTVAGKIGAMLRAAQPAERRS